MSKLTMTLKYALLHNRYIKVNAFKTNSALLKPLSQQIPLTVMY